MLLKVNHLSPSVHPPMIHLQNMQVAHFPAMTLFLQELVFPKDGEMSRGYVRVTYQPPQDCYPDQDKASWIDVPLVVDVEGLDMVDVVMWQSPTKAYEMGGRYNRWFSERFGYEVMLVYLGGHLRPVLGNLSPNSASRQGSASWTSWASGMIRQLPLARTATEDESEEGITFADVAPYLIVTQESLEDVSSRLSDGMEMDVTKFRPNIVLSGDQGAYDEDFWKSLAIMGGESAGGGVEKESEDKALFELTANCGRCKSINIDYTTGKPGDGETGRVLKKLMRDRRVDKGVKYNPVFGRYGFLKAAGSAIIAVGNEVHVTQRNVERTSFGKMYMCLGCGYEDAYFSCRLAWIEQYSLLIKKHPLHQNEATIMHTTWQVLLQSHLLGL